MTASPAAAEPARDTPKIRVFLVIVDDTDESRPMRYFYDYCKLPPSFGERRETAPAAAE